MKSRPVSQLAFLLRALLVLASFPAAAAAQCPIGYAQKIWAPVPRTNCFFGDVAEIHGDIALVGAQFDDYLCPPGTPDCSAGSVQVLTRMGGSWAAGATLTPAAPAEGDYFGVSLALGEDRALIGAYGRDTPAGANAGAVFDFRIQNGQWVQHATLLPSDPSNDDQFGWRVVMDGAIAAITSKSADAVYVFRWTAGDWIEEQKLTPGDVGDHGFGFSLAIWGDRILIGDNRADGVGAAYLYRYDGDSWVLEQKLTPPVPNLAVRFGENVAIRETYVLVSDTDEERGAPTSGAVHIYWNSGQGWLHQKRLDSPDPVAEGAFGYQLALGDHVAIVGELRSLPPEERNGQAYVFTFDDHVWTEATRLRPAEADAIDHFGSAIAMGETETLIGASGDDDPCGGGICLAGAVYVFPAFANCNANDAIDYCEIAGATAPDCNANGVPDACDIESGASDCDANGVPDACEIANGGDCNGNQMLDACEIAQGLAADCNLNGIPDVCDPFEPPSSEQKAIAAMAAATDQFGSAVAVFGDLAVVGAPLRDSPAQDAGAAYVRRLTNGVWLPQGTLIGSDLTSFDNFGGAVAVERDRVLVGAELVPSGPTAGGAVYEYRRINNAWVESAKIVPSALQANMRFGHAVAACGDLMVAGAHRESVNGVGQAGAAYVFRNDGTSWVQEQRLTAPVSAPGDLFGSSVAVDGDLVVVGEPNDDDLAVNAGAAHVYRFNGTSWVHEAKLTDPNGAFSDFLGTSVAVSGDLVAIGALRGTVGGNAVGKAVLFGWNGAAWVLRATVVKDPPQILSWFGNSLALAGKTLLVGAYSSDINAVRTGAAYLFDESPQGWDLRAEVTTSDLEAGDEIGKAVAFDGRSVVIGAPSEDTGGDASGACYFMEVPVGSAIVTRQPSSLRVAAGARASFTVGAVGTDPLSYRWQKDHVDLSDGPNVSGSTSSRLVIASAGAGDPAVYRCQVTSACGSATVSRDATLWVDGLTAVDEPHAAGLHVLGARPNPSRGETRLDFIAPARGHVSIEIYGLRGERVTRLLDGEVAAGPGTVSWNGLDERGVPVASGVYLCRLAGFGAEVTRRIVRVR